MKEISWNRVMVSLRKNYKNFAQLAEELGVTYQYMDRVCNQGMEPKYSVGAKLLELYDQHCCKKDTQ